MSRVRRFVGLTVAMLLVRPALVAASQAWHVDATPHVVQRELQFSDAGVKLRGTLFLPEHARDVPAIVLLHDASIGLRGDRVYRTLELGLPRIGIAVAAFDRRGEGASSGNGRTATFEDLARDGISAAEALAHNTRIDRHAIGFWGLSQGGWLSTLACSETALCAFSVSVSAPLVTPAEQMNFAVGNLFGVRGYGEAAKRKALAARRTYDDYVRGRVSLDATLATLAAVQGQPWFAATFLPTTQQLREDPHPRWRTQAGFDPMRALERIKVPVYLIFGGDDPWVPVNASLARLRTIQAQQPNVSYAIVPHANHRMFIVTHETMSYGPTGSAEPAFQAPDYFLLLSRWLTRVVNRS